MGLEGNKSHYIQSHWPNIPLSRRSYIRDTKLNISNTYTWRLKWENFNWSAGFSTKFECSDKTCCLNYFANQNLKLSAEKNKNIPRVRGGGFLSRTYSFSNDVDWLGFDFTSHTDIEILQLIQHEHKYCTKTYFVHVRIMYIYIFLAI